MKRLISFALICAMLFSLGLTAIADDGIIEEIAPTDLTDDLQPVDGTDEPLPPIEPAEDTPQPPEILIPIVTPTPAPTPEPTPDYSTMTPEQIRDIGKPVPDYIEDSWPVETTPYDNEKGYSEERNRLVDAVSGEVTSKSAMQESEEADPYKRELNGYERWYLEQKPGARLKYGISTWNTLFTVWAAGRAGLIEEGRFPLTTDAVELYDFLVAKGERFTDITKFDNSTHPFQKGDIIFEPILTDGGMEVGKRTCVVTDVQWNRVEIVSGAYSGGNVVRKGYTLDDIRTEKEFFAAEVCEFHYKTVADMEFEFLLKELDLNEAAACGIMANSLVESGFYPEKVGDGGYSLGLFQWQFQRRFDLGTYGENQDMNSLDVKTQLMYFKEEMLADYALTLKCLRNVPNTSEGAYKAASIFCKNYEAPLYTIWNCKRRALTAQQILWPMYSDNV